MKCIGVDIDIHRTNIDFERIPRFLFHFSAKRRKIFSIWEKKGKTIPCIVIPSIIDPCFFFSICFISMGKKFYVKEISSLKKKSETRFIGGKFSEKLNSRLAAPKLFLTEVNISKIWQHQEARRRVGNDRKESEIYVWGLEIWES